MVKVGPVASAVMIGDATGASTPVEGSAVIEAVMEMAELGYDMVWTPGGRGNNLRQVAEIVRWTTGITVASGITPIDQAPAAEVTQLYTELAATHPGRYIPGIGGAHGPRTIERLNAYLDELDPIVPASERALAAMGPRLLKLARDRADIAYPNTVTVDYVASAREILGDSTKLTVGVWVIPESDAGRARDAARAGVLSIMPGLPPYAANFRRMGFTESEINGLSDRFVDGVTVWGDLDTVIGRLREYRAAGADQIVVHLDGLPAEWRAALPRELT